MAIEAGDKILREENAQLKNELNKLSKELASLQIRPNQIMLPFVPKDAETDDMYGEGVEEVEGKGTQARLTSKQKREAFDKFVIDWRKQNSLEGTDVMPPNEVVPLWMRRAKGKNEDMTIAGNPSFDINETPATRRIRKIRTLEERGVGGEKGNAGDILKKGIQLPKLQANINKSLQRENVGGTLRDMMLPLLIKEYGKDSGGSYKNPSKLLSGMKKLAQVYRGDLNFHPRPLTYSLN